MMRNKDKEGNFEDRATIEWARIEESREED